MLKTRSICALEHEARGLRDGSVTTLIRPVKHRIVSNGFKFDRELGDILCHNDYLPPSEMLMQVRTRHKQYDVAESEGWEYESPFGPPGTRLAVREAWAAVWPGEHEVPLEECRIEYRADLPVGCKDGPGQWPPECKNDRDAPRWQPSSRMPAWAVRTHVTVKSVRVMRCGEIGAALACLAGHKADGTASGARDALQQWWAKNYGKRYPFASSWAWVVEVER